MGPMASALGCRDTGTEETTVTRAGGRCPCFAEPCLESRLMDLGFVTSCLPPSRCLIDLNGLNGAVNRLSLCRSQSDN